MLQVVIPEDEDWEKEWDEWHDQLWSQWKKVTPPELYRQKFSTESFTGNDDEEEWSPGPRVTEADHKNDTKSLERKLDRRLFLLLRRAGRRFESKQFAGADFMQHAMQPCDAKLLDMTLYSVFFTCF